MHRQDFFRNWIAIALALMALAPSVPANERSQNKPTNIILMIGDGMGFNQIEAASLYRTGTRKGLSVHRFPVQLACSTFPADGSYDPKDMWRDFGYAKSNPTDSAAAATALATGCKTANGCLGVSAARRAGFLIGEATVRTNIMECAKARHMSAGVVTTVPISHATPAGFLVHAMERSDYTAIAKQMLTSAADVIVGCGHPDPTNESPPNSLVRNSASDSRRFAWVGGEQTWTQLVAGVALSDANGDGTPDPWTLVQDTAAFRSLGSGPAPQRLLGIVRAKSTLQQARGGETRADPYAEPLTPDLPTLSDLTRAALNVLDDNTNGFVVMIEGGAVDWACHANSSGRCIEETLDFSDAIDSVLAYVDANKAWDHTLLIVTADHETGYLYGPDSGYKARWRFWEPIWKPLIPKGKGRVPGMAWHIDGHTNQLVPLYAIGAGAGELTAVATRADPVRGQYLDNTDVAKVIFRLLGASGLP